MNAETRAQSLAAIGLQGLKTSADKVFDICLAAQRNGIDDLSGKEIQARYEMLHGERIDSGTVSARVSSLLAAKRLERLTLSRHLHGDGARYLSGAGARNASSFDVLT